MLKEVQNNEAGGRQQMGTETEQEGSPGGQQTFITLLSGLVFAYEFPE